jgi:hypothetical protein
MVVQQCNKQQQQQQQTHGKCMHSTRCLCAVLEWEWVRGFGDMPWLCVGGGDTEMDLDGLEKKEVDQATF